MYLLLVHCLFERFVNMYLFSMFVNNHICCALVLFGTNCPYECRNNSNVCYQTCDILPFCNHFFSCSEITCVWGIEPLLIYRFLQQLTILYNKVWKDNWTYWDTCQYYMLCNNAHSNAIVNAASDITYRPVIEANDTCR